VYNPLLKNLKFTIAYALAWVLIGVIQIGFLHYQANVDLIISISDSTVFSIVFSVLGLASWYTVRYSKFQPLSSGVFWLNHIGASVIIIFLWYYLSYFILGQIYPDYIKSEIFLKSVPWRIASGFFFFSIIMLIYYLIINFSTLQEKKNAEERLQTLVKEAELEALKSQINPHFLFNSLNSISSLTMIDSERAQGMIIKLSEFLRYSLKYTKNELTTLKEEIKNIQLYLEIEKIRFGKKLKFNFEGVETCLDLEIPNLILQPLFENAIKFGVQESSGEVEIISKFASKDGLLVISIENNFESNIPSRKGGGVGLRNIQGRLSLIYNRTDLLEVIKADNSFLVTVKIPQNR